MFFEYKNVSERKGVRGSFLARNFFGGKMNPGGIEPPPTGPKPVILSVKLWVLENKIKFALI